MTKKAIKDEGKKKAERVIRFIETYCTHTKGKWAGKKFILLPWQKDIIYRLFGTLRKDGRRQYRICYVEIPKKNGKTELAAAIGLYMLCYDGEQGAEVYSAAADREQAGLIYHVASQMVRNNEKLSNRLTVIDSQKRIVDHKTGSFYKVLSAESYTKHGINPSCILFDELHTQPNDELWRVLTSGTDYAREQQLVFAMSTAGIYDINSIWWRIREKARQIKEGIINDDTFLPILYIADKDKDNPENEKLWIRVNPSINEIFTIDKIREDFAIAKQNPIDYADFLRFRLNIPIKQASRWIPMDKWDACAGAIDIDSLRGRVCYGGLDLSSKTDLAAFLLVFPPEDDEDLFDILCKFYCPEGSIIKRSKTDRVHYDIWAQEGYLISTPGDVIDYSFIEKDILDAAEEYQLTQVGFDPWNAQATASRIMAELNPTNGENGFQMVEIRQGTKSFNEPAKDLLVKIMTGKVRHGGHPVLRWCADNLVMRTDANANVAPDKEKATDKIDGMVALLMAWSRGMFGDVTESVYNERGVTIL